jgi:hypothetical protein
MYTFEPVHISFPKTTENITKNDKIERTFNFKTRETYRMKRILQLDVFNDENINKNECFKYYKKWDAYNGIVCEEDDEFGPLCFNGYQLAYYYYINRLNGIYNKPVDGFDGYYGDLLGTGKNINIISRGYHPERYLLRLPVIDCYAFDNSSHSHITMGPILSDNDIDNIDNILKYCLDTCGKYISPEQNLIKKIKYHYDEALNIEPSLTDIIMINLKKNFPLLNKDQIKEKYNRHHVEMLKLL